VCVGFLARCHRLIARMLSHDPGARMLSFLPLLRCNPSTDYAALHGSDSVTGFGCRSVRISPGKGEEM
jgi:hypothetical protein